MQTPRDWIARPSGKYYLFDDPKCEFCDCEIKEGTRGPILWTPKSPEALMFLCSAFLLRPPSRWNESSPLVAYVSGGPLIQTLEKLEQTILPKIPGKEEAHSCIKTNQFSETYVKVKITFVTRFYSQDGQQLQDMPSYTAGASVICLVGASPYRINGIKGISLRMFAIQDAQKMDPKVLNKHGGF